MSAAATEIKLIHIGRSALGMDEATYRAMLANLCNGKTSSKALTAQERQRVLDHMRDKGFKLKRRAGQGGTTHDTWRRAPQMRKLRALWYLLAEAGAVDHPADSQACDAAIEAWAKRQLSTHTPPLDALRFADGVQMSQLIEALKDWGLRVGAPVVER